VNIPKDPLTEAIETAKNAGQILLPEGKIVKGFLLLKPIDLRLNHQNHSHLREALDKIIDLCDIDGLHVRRYSEGLPQQDCIAYNWVPGENPLAEVIEKVKLIEKTADSYYGLLDLKSKRDLRARRARDKHLLLREKSGGDFSAT